MNQKPFFNNKLCGKRYLDHTFLSFEGEPIVFTCLNDSYETFFCYCTEFRFFQKWIVSKINLTVLEKLLYQIIDIRQAVLSLKSVIEITLKSDGLMSYTENTPFNLQDYDLPDPSCFVECNYKTAKAYLLSRVPNIESISNDITVQYNVSKPSWNYKDRFLNHYLNQTHDESRLIFSNPIDLDYSSSREQYIEKDFSKKIQLFAS